MDFHIDDEPIDRFICDARSPSLHFNKASSTALMYSGFRKTEGRGIQQPLVGRRRRRGTAVFVVGDASTVMTSCSTLQNGGACCVLHLHQVRPAAGPSRAAST